MKNQGNSGKKIEFFHFTKYGRTVIFRILRHTLLERSYYMFIGKFNSHHYVSSWRADKNSVFLHQNHGFTVSLHVFASLYHLSSGEV